MDFIVLNANGKNVYIPEEQFLGYQKWPNPIIINGKEITNLYQVELDNNTTIRIELDDFTIEKMNKILKKRAESVDKEEK